MAKIKKLGSVYFDDGPVLPGSKLGEQQFSIGDTYSGMELQWVCDGCRLVADRCICINISWEQLNQMGFVFGTPVRIDGELYLCRCLKVGALPDTPNEWDILLEQYGDDNDLWHWKGMYFLGQETPPDWATHRALRGDETARHWNLGNAAGRGVYVGFRPVLEPLFPELSDLLVGSNIKVFGPCGEIIEGQLAEYDDYDLVLDAATPSDCNWAVQHGGQSIISQKFLIGISDTKK